MSVEDQCACCAGLVEVQTWTAQTCGLPTVRTGPTDVDGGFADDSDVFGNPNLQVSGVDVCCDVDRLTIPGKPSQVDHQPADVDAVEVFHIGECVRFDQHVERF